MGDVLGVLVKPFKNVWSIYPIYNGCDGTCPYNYSYTGLSSALNEFDETEIIPLMFYKVDENYVAEITTNSIYLFGSVDKCKDYISSFNKNIETVQSAYNIVKFYPLILSDLNDCSLFKDTDNFRYIYYTNFNCNPKNVPWFSELNNNCINLFSEKERQVLDIMSGIAGVDNSIYDLKNKMKK